MAPAQEPDQRDFHAEARSLIAGAGSAALATAAEGQPHAALVTLAFMPDLAPVLLLSQLAIHTRQLVRNPACSLLITGPPGKPNPQTTPRLCLSGSAAASADPALREIFLAAHPYASLYAEFADFAFWRVELTGAYYIGGFGAARQLEVVRLQAGL